MPHRWYLLAQLADDLMTNAPIVAYFLFDSFVLNVPDLFRLLGALIFIVYILNMIRRRVVDSEYDGSWRKWFRHWMGLKRKEDENHG